VKPPYVTAWTGETGYVIRPSALLGGHAALFRADGKPGTGQPEWGIMSEERQRECVVKRRCQVCHRTLKMGFAYNLVMPRQILGMPATNEPLTCEACVPMVLRYCPGVRRQIEGGVALLARVRDYTVALTVVQPADGGNEDLNLALKQWRGAPPVGFCQVLLVEYDRVTVGELAVLG
jgi:hypothetical protein